MAKGPLLLFVDEGTDWLVEIRNRLVNDYHVLAVETGAQALGILESHRVAVLLTDNAMASVQDRRFGQSLRRHHGALPRILFSKRPELELAIATRNGDRADAALPKPCDPATAVALIHKVVGQATARLPVARSAPTERDPAVVVPQVSEHERETLPDPDSEG